MSALTVGPFLILSAYSRGAAHSFLGFLRQCERKKGIGGSCFSLIGSRRAEQSLFGAVFGIYYCFRRSSTVFVVKIAQNYKFWWLAPVI